MKYLLIYLVLFFLFSGCQHHETHHSSNIVVSQGKLKMINAVGKCGAQLAIVLENGERLVPANKQDLVPLPENTEIQVTYTELAASPADSCLMGKPVKISHIDKVIP